MKVLVTGAGGLVGSALCPALREGGHEVARLVRRRPSEGEVFWDPEADRVGPVDGFDAVIHLAGESIAGGRWTPSVKARIRDSRVKGTSLLAGALASSSRPPGVFIAASAVGYYGDRGDEVLTENSPPGTGFLPEVCRAWEEACAPLVDKGVRVVNLRFGVVLSRRGGALAKMLLPFRLGVGGVVGSGAQHMPWLALEDALGIVRFALSRKELAGPVNAVAPSSATNREFTKALGRALRRPTVFPLPAFAARLVLGEMADALLLAGARVLPEKLKASGYVFRRPTLEEGLKAALE